MTWRKWVIAAVLLAVPMWVWAQVVANDGSSTRGQTSGQAVGGFVIADTTLRVHRMDDSGNLKVLEAAPLSGNYRTGNLIDNQLTASTGAMADSNATPIQSYDLKRVGLMVYGIHDSLSTVVRLAFQIRAHPNTNTDSTSTFPWLRWSNVATSGVFRVDSIGQPLGVVNIPTTAVQTTNATVAVASPYLLPGEFEVIFNVARRDTVDGLAAPKPFSAPLGYYIPLTGPMGEWFWAPYFTVRVRVVNGVRSRFRLRVDYVGTSL